MDKYSQTNYRRMFLPALFITAGTILFGCQNKEEKKQKNEEVEVIIDTAATKPITLDKTTIENNSKQIPLPQPKKDKVKSEKPEETTDLKPQKESNPKSEKADNQKTNVSKETAAVPKTASSQINAEFPGGIDQFNAFFMKEYKKPENVYYWKLNFTLAFAVEKNGSVSFLECSPAVEEPLEKEIIRVLNLCPKWRPGELNGKKTRMQYSTPIFLHNKQ